MILTYKYRIKDRSARKVLRRHAVAVNQVWNYCNALQKDIEMRYRAGAPRRRWPSHYELQKLCKGVGAELGLHQQSVAGVCGQFAKSRDKAKRSLRFRASGGPKRALGWIPFERQSRQIDGDAIKYLGRKFRLFGVKRRPLPETARGGCFIEDSRGRWWVAINVEVNDLPMGGGSVGIDLGLSVLATLSDGRKIEPPRLYRRYEERLATAHRAHNKQRVRALHTKIKNARRDQLHKASCRIAGENALIAVGDIGASQLAKTRMAKSALDAGWSMFKAQLRYKASRHGAVYMNIDERFTTQTCSACGSIGGPKGIAGLGIRRWECSACGESHDRDVNAARNILSAALSAQRLVEENRRTH